jgi:phosphoglycolate phosphatase-like HAD superfamily hydrolase
MIKAVIIDLDDTLCMTEQVSFDMENETLQCMGRSPMPRAIHQQTWGKPLFEIIAVRSPGVDVAEFEKLFADVIGAYVSDGRFDSISRENLQVLDALVKEGKQLFVLTSRTHGELKHLLEPDHILAAHIKAFYYRDNMQFHKPDPRAFDILLMEHNLPSAGCVYIGDSISDAEAANKAHLRFIASLESGLRIRDDFNDHQVDVFVDSFKDAVGAVHSLDEELVAQS